MRSLLAIIFAIIVAALCSQPLMTGLQHLVVPHGQRLQVMSPAEPLAALALFTLSVCACAGLAAVAGCFLRRYSVGARWTIALLPMLATGLLVATLKAVQFREAVAAAEGIGMPPAFSLRQASLYMVPAVAFLAGLLSIAVAVFLRKRNGQPGAAPKAAPAHR